MGEHTKEPWKAAYEEGDDAELWIYNSEVGSKQYAIGVLFSLNPSAEKDASRIVACVNACAGISNEELELHNVKPVKAASDYISSLEAQLAESQRQNAELRGVMQRISNARISTVIERDKIIYSLVKRDYMLELYKALQESGNECYVPELEEA